MLPCPMPQIRTEFDRCSVPFPYEIQIFSETTNMFLQEMTPTLLYPSTDFPFEHLYAPTLLVTHDPGTLIPRQSGAL
jgi:hypothetical protein